MAINYTDSEGNSAIPGTRTTTYNSNPYYDDYDETKKFLKVLFRPGRAVQARELTQLQSILQAQIARGGAHIFKNGSRVLGGQQIYDRHLKYLALYFENMDNTEINVENFRGKTIRNASNTVYASVREVSPREGDDPPTLFITYEEDTLGEGFSPVEEILTYDPTGVDTSVYSAITRGVSVKDEDYFWLPDVRRIEAKASDGLVVHTGECSLYEVQNGVYYYKGEYLLADSQSVVLSKYSGNTSYRIGYSVEEEIITASDDASLYDPASGFSNFTAPGSDRRKVTLTLKKVGDGVTIKETPENNFFEIARLDEGRRIWFTEFPNYSVIEQTLATRTHEESGNYTVKPYNATKEARGNPNEPTFLVKLSGGTAYVEGHRYNMIKSSYAIMDKARSYVSQTGAVASPYEPMNYVTVYDHANTTHPTHPENANSMFDIVSNELVYLHAQNRAQVGAYSLATENDWNSTLCATARVQSFVYDEYATQKRRDAGEEGYAYKLYLFDIKPSVVEGKVGQPNKIAVTDAWTYGTDTFFKFDPAPSGRHAYHTSDYYWHGFASSTPIPADVVNLPVDATSTGDLISVSGSDGAAYSLRNEPVKFANATHISVPGDWSSATDFSAITGSLYIKRATGGYSSRRTIMLDANTASQWNDTYEGATIRITAGPAAGEKRTIVGYCGNASAAATVQIDLLGADANNHLAYSGSIGRPRLLVVDREFSAEPTTATEYKIALGIHQARSVVANLVHTDAVANAIVFPTDPNTRWDIDPIAGISGTEKISKDNIVQIRERGRTTFRNKGTPALISLGNGPLRSAQTFATGTDAEHGNVTFVTTRTFDLILDGSSQVVVNTFSHFGTPEYWNKWDGSAGTGDEEFLPLRTSTGDLSTKEKQAFWQVIDPETGKSRSPSASFADGGFIVTPHSTEVMKSVVVKVGPASMAGGPVRIIAPVRIQNARPKPKRFHTVNTSQFSIHKGIDSGHVVIRSKDSHLNETDGKPSANIAGDTISLGIADVYNVSVFSSFTNGTQLSNSMVVDSAHDITDWFEFDNGQRDHFYDHAKLTLKEGFPADRLDGQIVAFVDFWEHDNTDQGFFSVDSYRHTTDLFHGDSSGTDYNTTIPFLENQRVSGNNSGVSGWVHSHYNEVAGRRVLKISGYTPNSTDNTYFQVGERVENANGDTWVKVASRGNSDISFTGITTYVSPDSGARFPLRNYLDFRPVRQTDDYSANAKFHVPIPLTSHDSTLQRTIDFNTGDIIQESLPIDVSGNIQYYQKRIDSLVLTRDGKFKSVPGVASDNPRPLSSAEEKKEGYMTLFHVRLPAYTTSLNAVSLKKIDQQRYTMKDISRLDKRIKNLEYYVVLNTLEKATRDLTITDGNGLDRFKNGILIDNFDGTGVVDVNLPDTRYKFAINPSTGQLFPGRAVVDKKRFKLDSDSSSGIRSHIENQMITLNYSETPYIQQPLATSSVSVNPFSVKSFSGLIALTPDFDRWIDTAHVTVQDVDNRTTYDNLTTPGNDPASAAMEIIGALSPTDFGGIVFEYDAAGVRDPDKFGLGGDVGSWTQGESVEDGTAAGILFDSGTTVLQRTNTQLIPQVVDTEHSIPGTTQSSELVAHMRKKDIIVHATGMKPYSPVHAFFDEKPVSRFVSRANEVYIDPTSLQTSHDGGNFFTCENLRGGATEHEEVILKGDAGEQGRATLLAIRENAYGTYAVIVPTTNAVSGLVSDNGRTDSYYESGPTVRFNEISAATITGATSGATATLSNDPGSGLDFKKNGHFSGILADANTNSTGGLQHPDRGGWIQFSEDASNYIANSFGYETSYANDIITNSGVINITDGVGEGVQLRVSYYDAETRFAFCPSMAHGWEGEEEGGPRGRIPTAGDQYTIINAPSTKNPDPVSGSNFTGLPVPCGPVPFTNRHGEFFGIFHLPSSDATLRFPYGEAIFVLSDRGDNNPIFTTSHAQRKYSAVGTETTVSHFNTIISTRDSSVKVLQANAFEIGVDPLTSGAITPILSEGTSTQGVFACIVAVHHHPDINKSKNWDPGSGKDRGRNVFGEATGGQTGQAAIRYGLPGALPTPNFPGVSFIGGDFAGVEGYCNVGDDGKISEIKITSPGLCLVDGSGYFGAPERFAMYKKKHHSRAKWFAPFFPIEAPDVIVPTSNDGVPTDPTGGGHGKFNSADAFHAIIARSDTYEGADDIRDFLGAMADGNNLTAAQADALASFESQDYEDPLAQSFTVLAEGPSKDGVFITGVDLFFAGKPEVTATDTAVGVEVSLRGMTNGLPSNVYLPTGGGKDAKKELFPSEVNIADADPQKTNIVPSLDMANTATSFMFDAPVYCAPGKGYAIVIQSNSNKYQLWIANQNENLVGTGVTTAAIPIGGSADAVFATSPTTQIGGTLFKSEIGAGKYMPWIADTDSDLMYRIHRAEFDTSRGIAYLKAGEDIESANNLIHNFQVQYAANKPGSSDVTFKYRAPDTDGNLAEFTMLSSDGIHENIANSILMRSDGTDYTEFGSFEVRGVMSTISSYISPVIDLTNFEIEFNANKINNGELNIEGISIPNGGAGYDTDDTFTTSGGGGSGVVFTVGSVNADGEIMSMVVTNSGSGYHSTPTIVPLSADGNGADIQYAGETGRTGGNSAAKYVTRRVNLRDGFDAKDINVFLSANKPEGTNIHVYYKVLAAEDSDSFVNKNWVRMIPDNPTQVNRRRIEQRHQDAIMSEYIYTTGENELITYDDGLGGEFDTFQSFAIKIVMFSDNSVKHPIVRDMRAIALT